MSWLIDAPQLDKFRKHHKHLVIFDASWYFPEENRNATDDFLQAHIPGAYFFDHTLFYDLTSPLPNMLDRDEKKLADQCSQLGITSDHKIVFYDNSPIHTSARALWMMKVFGHNPYQLYILDGGMAAWKQYGGKIEQGESLPIAAKKPYEIRFQSKLIRTLAEMKENIHHPKEQVVDMRHPARFAGGKEVRLGLRTGHIPESFCFPYFTMFESSGRFKPLDKIRKQLLTLGVELTFPIVATCGSGMTAAILDFVLDLMNHDAHSVYDGAWSEWGANTLYSCETSLDERPIITSLIEEPFAPFV